MAKTYCSSCGREINDNARFCMYCGKPIFNNGNIDIDNTQLHKQKKEDLLKGNILKIISGIFGALGFVYIFAGIQYNQSEDAKMDMLFSGVSSKSHIFGSAGATDLITQGLILIVIAIILCIVAFKAFPKNR